MAKSTATNTSSAIGTVKALMGSATATDKNGVVRTLHIGDKVYASEVINAAASGGTIHIEFNNASFATLGSGQSLELAGTVFTPTETQEKPLSVEELQAKIAAGEDVTQIMEATAAGAAAGGGDDSGHQFVVVEQNAARGEVTPGFDTGTFTSLAGLSNNDDGLVMGRVGTGDGSGGDGGGGGDPGPSYNARAVMYEKESGNSTSVTLTGLQTQEDPTWINSENSDIGQYFDIQKVGDSWTISLNAAGKTALAAGELDAYNYLKVIGADGKTYTIQVIINQDNSFNSGVEDADKTHGYELAPGGLIHGEWHEGKDFTQSGDINPSSNLGDYVTFKGDVAGGTINTAGGSDTITVDKLVINSNINAGSDANTVTVGGMLAKDGGNNSIYSGDGTITVKVDSDSTVAGVHLENGGKNTIKTENAAILVDVKTTGNGAWGVEANSGQNQLIATENGSIDVKVQATNWGTGINAEGSGSNSLSTNTGNLTVKVDANEAVGVYTNTTGNGNTLSTGSGDILIEAKGGDVHAHGLKAYNGTNTLSSNEGDITINATSKGQSIGMLASGTEAVNKIIGSDQGTVNVTAQNIGGTSSNAWALYAGNGGHNDITADSGRLSNVNITAQTNRDPGATSGAGFAGLDARSSGSNTISNADHVTILANRDGTSNNVIGTGSGRGSGLYAEEGGKNTLTDVGTVTIRAGSTGNSVYGIHASGNKDAASLTETSNTIDANGKVTVDVTGQSAGTAYGLKAGILDSSGTYYNGKNAITTTDGVQIDVRNTANGYAYGLNAEYKSVNSITAGSTVDITAKTESGYATGLSASTGAANTITSTDGDINVTVSSTNGGVMGMRASEGTNTIKAGGDINLTASAENSYLTGLQSVGTNSAISNANTLTADGKISLDFKASGFVRGMEAEPGNNSNTLTAGTGIDIDIVSTKAGASAISNTSGLGATTLTATTGNVDIDVHAQGTTANANNAGGIYTGGGKTTVEAKDGDVLLKVTSDLGKAEGISTVSNGLTKVIASDMVDIQAQGKTGATGLYVESQNTGQWAKTSIEAGSVNIEAQTTDGKALGIYNLAGENNIHATGKVDIGASSSTGIAYGLYAEKSNSKVGQNIVASDTETVKVTVSGTTAHGLFAGMEKAPGNPGEGGGKNTVSGKTVDIDVTGTGTGISTGMKAQYGGENSITATDKVALSVNSTNSAAIGLYATENGTNTIKAGDGGITVSAKASDAGASGLQAFAYGTETVKNTLTTTGVGDIKVTATGINGDAQYLYPVYGLAGNNQLTTANGNITVIASSENSDATGLFNQMSSTTGTGNVLESTGSGHVLIDVKGNTSSAGLGASKLDNSIRTHDGSIQVKVVGNGVGSAGDMIMRTSGLLATAGHTNTVESKNSTVTINVEAKGGNASGMYTGYAQNASGHNIVSGGNGINLNVDAPNVAYGIWSSTGKSTIGSNTLTAASGDVNINVNQNQTGASDYVLGNKAYGIASDGGVNRVGVNAQNTVINTGDININVAAKQNAYGLYSVANGTDAGKNIVGTTGDVNISVKSTHGGASGLYASGTGSVNTIQAGTGSEGITVVIQVQAGTGQAAYAMFAQSSGKNDILGSKQGDVINITGDIKAENGGQNIISTGLGNDLIVLNGTVYANSLDIKAGVSGTADHDTLVLKAASYSAFIAQYNALDFAAMHIESIFVLSGADAIQQGLLSTWFNNHHYTGSITYTDHYYQAEVSHLNIEGSAVNDIIMGSHDDNVLNGGDGNDLIHGVGGDNVLIGGAGSDTLYGGAGHDILIAGDVNSTYELSGLKYSNLVDTDGHINLTAIDALKAALTDSSSDHNYLSGGAGNDILFGGPGHDTLHGGAGDDVLVSGSGQTTFVYQQGDLNGVVHGDTILGFKHVEGGGGDVLDISDLLSGSGATSSNLISGGYLNFGDITQNEDGSTTVKLSIDTDGTGGAQSSVALAEITMQGFTLTPGGHADQANDILNHLMANNELKF